MWQSLFMALQQNYYLSLSPHLPFFVTFSFYSLSLSHARMTLAPSLSLSLFLSLSQPLTHCLVKSPYLSPSQVSYLEGVNIESVEA